MSNFPGKGKVAVLKTTPETVFQDIENVMRQAGVESTLPKNIPTGLMINLSWQTWYPACSTTPWQMEGAIRALHKMGYKDLSAIHNDSVVVDTKQGEVNNKHKFVTDTYQIPCTYLYNQSFEWAQYQPRTRPFLVLDKVFPHGVFIPKTLIGKNIVHLPTIKTHAFTTITGAMKNAFGGLLHRQRHWTHRVIHETLVDLLMIQQEIHPGLFAVMDGTFAGDGAGPRAMRWHEKNILLASADQVAIDAVSARLQGFDPLSIPFIRIAHEIDLGIGDPRQIEITGYDIEQEGSWNFIQEDTLASRGQKMIYHGRLRPFEKLLLQSPLVPWSYLASNLYHNVYWYPFVGRKRAQQALQTRWGQYFQSYGDGSLVLPGVEKKTILRAGLAVGIVAGVLGLIAVLLNQRKKK